MQAHEGVENDDPRPQTFDLREQATAVVRHVEADDGETPEARPSAAPRSALRARRRDRRRGGSRAPPRGRPLRG